MINISKKLLEFFERDKIRFVVFSLTLILTILVFGVIAGAYESVRKIDKEQERIVENQSKFEEAINKYKELKSLLVFFDLVGIDSGKYFSDLEKIRDLLNSSNYDEAIAYINNLIARMNQDKEALEGTLKGTVTYGSTPLKDCTIELLIGEESKKAYEAKSGESGEYEIKPVENSYTLKTLCEGYNEYTKDITVVAGEEQIVDQSPTKISTAPRSYVPKSYSPPSSGSSTANSTYEHKTVDTAVGSFTIDLITLNLGSGGIRVVTDTASDNDCTDNCPTIPLSSYVGRNGGFAGIHGTYFCPADYASCAGQSSSFFWKILNPRVGKMINGSNGLAEYDDYYAFSGSGHPTFFGDWIAGAGGGYYSGINSGPALVKGGANVLNWGTLDDKQKYTKSNRGAIGLTGSTMYVMIASNATVPDTVEIMLTLGCQYATEIDGGGSVAMYYNGSYKRGPGRSLPNAIVFVGG